MVVPKLESVPRLLPGELSLRDPACKPYYNEAHFAFFRFDVTTCGTTRTVRWGHSHQAFTLLLLFYQMIYFYLFSLSGTPWNMRMWSPGRKMSLCPRPPNFNLSQNTGYGRAVSQWKFYSLCISKLCPLKQARLCLNINQLFGKKKN